MDAAKPLSSARRRLLAASFFRMAGVSKRAGSSVSRGFIVGASETEMYKKLEFLYMLNAMCIESSAFFAASLQTEWAL